MTQFFGRDLVVLHTNTFHLHDWSQCGCLNKEHSISVDWGPKSFWYSKFGGSVTNGVLACQLGGSLHCGDICAGWENSHYIKSLSRTCP